MIDVDACKGCDLCIDACPPGVLEMTDARGQRPGLPVPPAPGGVHRLPGVLADLSRLRLPVYKNETPMELPKGGP